MFFALTGVLPNVPLEQQKEDDLLWIRKEFLDFGAPHPKLIVHGQTPVKSPNQISNWTNVDGGAGYAGPLVLVVIEAGKMHALF